MHSPRGILFDVQRYSLHDGPGIRTTVFFKGCPLRCAWCQNPESMRREPEIAFLAERCQGSAECIGACPEEIRRERGVVTDPVRCTACGRCAAACPHAALRLVGRTVDVDTLYAEVNRDRSYYVASGGGVTLSGGEPTYQMEFMGAFAMRCKEQGLHVGLQTCGAFAWDAFVPYVGLFDFIHYDLKIVDPEVHQRLTGTSNRLILDNARRLLTLGSRLQFRTPVIPGYTDGLDNLGAIAGFLSSQGIFSIHLLRYHCMGEAKLRRIATPLQSLGLGIEVMTTEHVEKAVKYFRERGFEVTT